MRYVRFLSDGTPRYGIGRDDSVAELSAAPWAGGTATGMMRPLAGLRLLAPCDPGKILAVGLNYRSHLGQSHPQREAPAVPEIFLKPISALVGPDEPIVIPQGATQVEPEGELVIVMGRRAKGVAPADAPGLIFGYTCGNDVSARDWQQGDLQWWRAKGADTFAALGPAVVTELEPARLTLQTRINGQVAQESGVDQLIHDVAHIVSFISSAVTLEPGDVIYTGTPGKPQPITAGDVVEVEISEIGILTNPVR